MRRALDLIPRRRRDGAIARAEALAAAGRLDDALRALRALSVREFGDLLFRVPDRFPALAAALPRMPTDEVQQSWTGSSGRPLLRQTTAFVETMERAFTRLCGRPLEDATILDYGCGWGRMLRLMSRYSPPARLHGIDAWDTSLEACRATGILGNLAKCDDVPRTLPFGDVAFDLVYAFSLFTHLSERTARAVLAAIRRRIRDDGLLTLTVRPPEYWSVQPHFPPGANAGTLRAMHAERGFAFIPQGRPPIDGEVAFGDTSISLEYVRREWTEWQLAGHETNRVDPHQLVLFLRPR